MTKEERDRRQNPYPQRQQEKKKKKDDNCAVYWLLVPTESEVIAQTVISETDREKEPSPPLASLRRKVKQKPRAPTATTAQRK